MEKIMFIALCFFSSLANSQAWQAFTDSAKVHLGQKDNAGAVEFYLKANEALQKDSSTTLTYVQNNDALGDLYVNMGQYAKAEPFYAKSVELKEKLNGKQTAGYSTSAHNLGRLYRLLGQYEKSEKLLIEARNIRKAVLGTQNADYANTTNNLGILYVEAGDYDQAMPLYQEAMKIRIEVLGKDHIDYAASCNNMAILFLVTGRYLEAEPLYLEAKRIREKALGKEHPFYAASCNNLGALYLDRGQYSKAEPLYIEAKEIRERTLGKGHPEYAASCNNLAILYMDIGQFEKAEPLYYEALHTLEMAVGKKHIDYARGCNNLGLFYLKLGQFSKAEALFIEARDVAGEVLGKNHFEYAKTCNNLGALYMTSGDYVKAAPLYEEAKSITEKVLGKEHPEYAKSCHNLGLISWNLGDYDKAIGLMEEAKAIRAKVLGKDNIDYAQTCDNLAVIYADKGRMKEAEAEHLEAKRVRGAVLGIEHPAYVESCMNLGNLYRRLNEPMKADSEYAEALHSEKAQVNKIFKFTTEPEKMAYMKKINEYKNYFLSYKYGDHQSSDAGEIYDLSLSYRQSVLNSLQQLRMAVHDANDSAVANQYNEWINARSQLAFLYTKPARERESEVKVLEARADSLEKLLSRFSSAFRKEQQQVGNWETVRNDLKPGEAAIEFMEFEFYNGKNWTDSVYYVAAVLRKDKARPEFIRLFEKKALDARISYRNSSPGQHVISALYGKATSSNNNSLYDLIWKPLEKELLGVKTIYFSPAGTLHKIAFAALPVSADKVLSDQYKLIQMNTTASISEKSLVKVVPSDKMLLYGGIRYDADSVSMKKVAGSYHEDDYASRQVPGQLLREGVNEFPYLSESSKEVRAIEEMARQKKYSAVVVEGVAASEESFKSLSGQHSPELIHTATHGFFFSDPKDMKKDDRSGGAAVFEQSDDPLIRAGLAMAGANSAWKGKPVAGIEDGILTAYEVSNMYLPNTRLAILSACETGLGEVQGSEGVYGLQRAFKMAGVKILVMSLWRVSDLAASEFMQELYKGLFSQQPVEDAFYKAQTILKNKYRSDPYQWAAWILVK